jgi:hypothetical protein
MNGEGEKLQEKVVKEVEEGNTQRHELHVVKGSPTQIPNYEQFTGYKYSNGSGERMTKFEISKKGVAKLLMENELDGNRN